VWGTEKSFRVLAVPILKKCRGRNRGKKTSQLIPRFMGAFGGKERFAQKVQLRKKAKGVCRVPRGALSANVRRFMTKHCPRPTVPAIFRGVKKNERGGTFALGDHYRPCAQEGLRHVSLKKLSLFYKEGGLKRSAGRQKKRKKNQNAAGKTILPAIKSEKKVLRPLISKREAACRRKRRADCDRSIRGKPKEKKKKQAERGKTGPVERPGQDGGTRVGYIS